MGWRQWADELDYYNMKAVRPEKVCSTANANAIHNGDSTMVLLGQ